jgi:hypothetical protein
LRGARAFPLTAAALLAPLGVFWAPGAVAQQRPPQQQPAASSSKEAKQPAADAKAFTLRVTKTGAARSFRLVAKEAKLADVAGELSRQLEVPVKLSPLMAQQKVTVDFSGIDLEAALRFLAPHPIIDYVAGGDASGQPKPLAVYLYAMNEATPALNETVKSSVDSMLIEGNTEDGTEEYEQKKKEEPLEISFANNRLSVRAEKQPLSVVLYKIASELGVPFELQHDTGEVVDANFQQYPVDQAMRSLSPSVRLFYRSDLWNSEKYPIRIALSGPAGAAPAPGKN